MSKMGKISAEELEEICEALEIRAASLEKWLIETKSNKKHRDNIKKHAYSLFKLSDSLRLRFGGDTQQ